MIPREPGEFGGALLARDARRHAAATSTACRSRSTPTAKGSTSTATSRPTGARNSSRSAPGRTRPASPRCARWSTSSSSTRTSAPASASTPTGRDPAADGHAVRRRHDARGPVDLQAPVGAGRKAHRLPGDQHLRRLQATTRRKSSPARRTGCTSTSGALFWTVEIWAPNKEAGITDYDWIHWYREHPPEDDLKLLRWSDEPVRRPGARRLVSVPASAARRGRARRLGQAELLAQPAAASARARGRALSAVADAARVALPKLEVLRTEVRALGADTWRVRFAVANAGYLPAYVSAARARTQDGARRGVRDRAARGLRAGRRQAAHRRPAAGRPCDQELAAGVPAEPRQSPPTARWPNGWCTRRAARGSR